MSVPVGEKQARERHQPKDGSGIAAAIFDWDGVVVDSSEYHRRSWEHLAAERALPLPEGHFERGFGMRNETIIPEVLRWTHDAGEIAELSYAKEEHYRRLVKDEGLRALPGVFPLLELLQSKGTACAVGTSTPRENITLSLEVLGLSRFFPVVTASEDVERGKPDPQVFLTAARRLNANPGACVVIEDAPRGIEAGRRAGMYVVGVATTRSRENLHEAHLIVDTLRQVTWPKLEAVVQREQPGNDGTRPSTPAGRR